jgi:rSAM/selenodomain-associated transferase 1
LALRPVIILFAKAPVPGRVKTRLLARLTPGQAAGLHSAFVCDTLDKLLQLKEVDVELHTDVPWPGWISLPVPQSLQSPGDLGARMLHALATALHLGRPQALVLGADSPTLPSAHLVELLAAPADVALGPTEDGGFYAIAARRIHPSMFASVPWSAPNTLNRTSAAVRACGLTVTLGPSWYDVDQPADLARLEKEPDLPPHTSHCLRDLSTN